MAVELGSGMQPARARSRDELVVRGDLADEVHAQVGQLGARLEQLIRQLTKTPPAPVVNVPPTNVTVAAPNVTVQAEAAEAPEFTLTLPGMGELRGEVAGLRADVQALTTELRKPVVREVQRDASGAILKITERR